MCVTRDAEADKTICRKPEQSTGAGLGSMNHLRKTTRKSMPIVCTNCLRKFLRGTLCANLNEQRQRDYIFRATCNYLDGRDKGNSRRNSGECSSQGCIWKELEVHLMKDEITHGNWTHESLALGNMAHSPQKQEDDELTTRTRDFDYETEPEEWKWQTSFSPYGAETKESGPNSPPWYNHLDLGSLNVPSIGVIPVLERRERYIGPSGGKGYMTFPDQTQEMHPSGLTDTTQKKPCCSTTSTVGCNSPFSYGSWTSTKHEHQRKVGSSIGCPEGSSSPPIPIRSPGTDGENSESHYSELSNDDSPRWFDSD